MRSMTALAIFLFAALPAVAQAAEARVAMKGYDPVAYFTEQRPVKGVAGISHEWDDTHYHFSTNRHREMFAADPERYAPRFSGNCTSAVAKGMTYEADPEAWMIVDGRLYLFSSARARKEFEANPAALAKAEEAWRVKRTGSGSGAMPQKPALRNPS